MEAISTIDKSMLPIVIVKFSKEEATEEQFDEHLNRMYKMYSEHDKVLVVFDTSQAKYLSSALRIKQGKWLKKHHQLLRETIIAAVYVSRSFIMKTILKGIFLVHAPDWERKVVTDVDNGLKWANEKLKEKGYEIAAK